MRLQTAQELLRQADKRKRAEKAKGRTYLLRKY
jgi:hypothetical protein